MANLLVKSVVEKPWPRENCPSQPHWSPWSRVDIRPSRERVPIHLMLPRSQSRDWMRFESPLQGISNPNQVMLILQKNQSSFLLGVEYKTRITSFWQRIWLRLLVELSQDRARS